MEKTSEAGAQRASPFDIWAALGAPWQSQWRKDAFDRRGGGWQQWRTEGPDVRMRVEQDRIGWYRVALAISRRGVRGKAWIAWTWSETRGRPEGTEALVLGVERDLGEPQAPNPGGVVFTAGDHEGICQRLHLRCRVQGGVVDAMLHDIYILSEEPGEITKIAKALEKQAGGDNIWNQVAVQCGEDNPEVAFATQWHEVYKVGTAQAGNVVETGRRGLEKRRLEAAAPRADEQAAA